MPVAHIVHLRNWTIVSIHGPESEYIATSNTVLFGCPTLFGAQRIADIVSNVKFLEHE